MQLGVLLLILPLMLATLGLQVVSRQGWNHPPDSRYYLTMMSRDMGYSWGTSVHQEQQISPGLHLAPWYFADNDPTWQMVRTRVLYPVLSLPFIYLWGLSGGSLAIPFLGCVLFLWATAQVLQRLYGPVITVIVAGAFSVTATVTMFAWAGTDTLAMGLAAVIVANLPIERRVTKANLVWLGAASIFIALTRQVGVLAPAMAGAGWLWTLVRERNWRNRWLGSLVVTACTTFVITVLSMTLVKTDTAGMIGRGQTTYWGIFRQFVHYLKVVTEQACTYMWHTDRVLYAIFIAAGVAVVVRFASDAAAVFFGAACSAYLISAGIGFSADMRYEMIIYPAAAVGAGELVHTLLKRHLVQPTGDAATATDATDAAAVAAIAADDQRRTRVRRWTPGFVDTLRSSKPGRILGLNGSRQDRWKPQLAFNAAALAVVIGVSVHGSWSSTIVAPPSPSFEAAQGSSGYAVSPRATQPAEQTLRIFFQQAIGLAHDSTQLQGALDWVHLTRYRPLAPDEPGWNTRAKDGTAEVAPNSMGQQLDEQEAFGRGLSLNLTVNPDTVKILSRQVSEFGEDVVFTVEDNSGHVHQGTATTLYPIWNKVDPAVVTSLVFDN